MHRVSIPGPRAGDNDLTAMYTEIARSVSTNACDILLNPCSAVEFPEPCLSGPGSAQKVISVMQMLDQDANRLVDIPCWLLISSEASTF
jgi:hypothetical protein